MVTARGGNFPNIFLQFIKYQVQYLVVDMLKYVKIPAACGNLWLNMIKNDKFQYLVTPPTSKEQLWNQGEIKLFYLPSKVFTLNSG